MTRPAFFRLVLSLLILARVSPALAIDTVAAPIALLQGLDKTTARISRFEAKVGSTVQFGNLSITVRDCEKRSPEETPENAAFLEIDENRAGNRTTRVFSGWMFASSPALSALENAVYDVNLLDCKGLPPAASTAPIPSGNASGKRTR